MKEQSFFIQHRSYIHKKLTIPHIINIVRYWCICQEIMKFIFFLDFRGPPHSQTSILNKLWNSINSFIIQANFDYQWTFVPMNFNDFTVTESDLVNLYKILSLPARLVYGHDIEWFSCTRRVMYDNNHGNVQQVFPVSTPNDQKHKIKIQSVKLNHSVLSTILLWQS